MDWNKGYSAFYYMTEVDPVTWNDMGKISISGGSITRQTSGLRQSADINCADYSQNSERYVRIYLDARQSETGAHIPLFTGLAISPDKDIKGNWSNNRLKCFSVLKPADDVILARGWYASNDIACSTIIANLLSPVIAPLEFEDKDSTLDNMIVAQSGETNLSMIEKILASMNWRLNINGDGTIVFGEHPEKTSAIFNYSLFDVIEPDIKVNKSWFDCPNVFMAVNNFGSAVARDQDDESPLSIQNRGREVWMFEDSPALNRGESLEEYANRRLREEQSYVVTVSYDRRFVPNIYPGDIVTICYPNQELDGEYIVTSQDIKLGYCATTSETVAGAS